MPFVHRSRVQREIHTLCVITTSGLCTGLITDSVQWVAFWDWLRQFSMNGTSSTYTRHLTNYNCEPRQTHVRVDNLNGMPAYKGRNGAV